MKPLLLFLIVVFPFGLDAQTVHLDSVSQTRICVGDSIKVCYSSHGTFKSDNFFAVQLSDASGDFTTFTNIGHATGLADYVNVPLTNIGGLWRVRIISTNPYTISDTSPAISAVQYPTPTPGSNLRTTQYLGQVAFAGELITLCDQSREPGGSSSFWTFGQDANIQSLTNSSPSIIYPTTGRKSGSLTVSNGTGCTITAPFYLTVVSCMPAIPNSVHIVTGTESGHFPIVWVKAGANYTNEPGDSGVVIFVDAGATLEVGDNSAGVYYLKTGSSFSGDNLSEFGTVFLSRGNVINLNRFAIIDTVYCDDLEFDYSQAGVPEEKDPLEIEVHNNSITIQHSGNTISIDLFNPVGMVLKTKSAQDELALDLSALTNGVYFASVNSGKRHEIRKILIMH